ncbi:hypothetical protein ACS0TY_015272 [Phlomoides rotata]
MASSPQFLATFFLFIIFSLSSPLVSAKCTSYDFSGKEVYTFCNDLPTLNSHLNWAYDQAQSTLSIAFVAPQARPNGWVSWAINPTSTGMVGSQALIAFRDSRGEMIVKTYNVSSYGPLAPSKVWYEVKESSAEYSGGVIRLFATLVLPEKGITTVNHVWQVGQSVTGGVPDKHEFGQGNLDSKGSLDLLGRHNVNRDDGWDSRTKNAIVSLYFVSEKIAKTGLVVPTIALRGSIFQLLQGGYRTFKLLHIKIGIIIARYLRAFPSADPAWFYFHVSCQILAYVVGVAGTGTGLKLGIQSKGVTQYFHRNVGATLFVLATLQVFALFARPQKEHKYRMYWNIYHHGCGYLVLVLGILNVFKGLYILRPPSKWIIGYIFTIIALGVIALFLEVITFIFARRRKQLMVSRTRDGYNY